MGNTELKPAAIRKLVIRGQNAVYGAAPLAVGEHNGEMWATNRAWATRAARVAPLLAEYNLPADQPGLYGVNSRVSRVDKPAPEMPAALTRIADYAIPSARVLIAGQFVYTTDYKGVLMDLYQLANGTHAGLLSDELAWLSGTADVPVPEDCHVSGVRLMFKVMDSGNTSAAVIGDVTRVITPAKYGEEARQHAAETGCHLVLGYVPAVTEPGEPVVLAITMATRYDG
jgi:hypothetical protein